MNNYGRLVKLAALAAIGCASLLLIIKTIAWWLTGSVSILAAVVDSFVDIAASLTNLLVIRYSLQPPDKDHSFGHGKAESLAALAQGMFILGSAIFLVLSGVQHLMNPQELIAPDIGIIIIVVSLCMTVALLFFQRWVIKKTNSLAIKADMLHYQSDVLMNLAVLIALMLSIYGVVWADAIFAIGIGIYILFNVYKIVYSAVQSLLDRALPDSERQLIIDIIQSWPNVMGAHDLRTRQSGAIKFIQFHLELDDNLPLFDAHAIADDVEKALLAHFPNAEILIHQDPASVVNSEQGHWQF